MIFFLSILFLLILLYFIHRIKSKTARKYMYFSLFLFAGILIIYLFFQTDQPAGYSLNRLDSLESVAGRNQGILDIESSLITRREDRISIVEKRIKLASPVRDAEFKIYDVNAGNNRSIPGASDRDYRVIMRVKPEYLNHWTEGFEPAGSYNYSWIEDMPRYKKWGLKSRPHIYKRQNEQSWVLIFQPENVVVKHFEAH